MIVTGTDTPAEDVMDEETGVSLSASLLETTAEKDIPESEKLRDSCGGDPNEAQTSELKYA